jgi:septal ring factor EnvC (AmiA/AmiB activator)
MPKEEIRAALQQLHSELEQAPPLDEELRRLLVAVDADIHQVLHQPTAADGQLSGLRERVEALAADLAAQHPAAERFVRELINALGRMGV